MAKGKQRRKLRREARRAAFRLARRGEEITAEAVADEIVGGGDLKSGDLAAWDWDEFMAFLEKLLPWIMKLIDLFT